MVSLLRVLFLNYFCLNLSCRSKIFDELSSTVELI